MKILVVDDEEFIRSLVVEILIENHFASSEEIFLAENGQSGFEIFKKEGPEIVISDVIMPISTGTELAKKIRDVSESVKIILMTGFTDADISTEIPRQDISQLIQKPFHPQTLVQALKDIVD